MPFDPNRDLNPYTLLDSRAEGWNRAFQRRSSGPEPRGTEGWRMADGGAGLRLGNGRTLWVWGDTFTTFLEAGDDPVRKPRFIFGSTIAVSGVEPPSDEVCFTSPDTLVPTCVETTNPINFFARNSQTLRGVDITFGEGVKQLGFGSGAWIPTLHELDPCETRTFFWYDGGTVVDGTPNFFYREGAFKLPAPEPELCGGWPNIRSTGRIFQIHFLNTQDRDARNWVVGFPPRLLHNAFGESPNVGWSTFYDNRGDPADPYIFGFGIAKPVVDGPDHLYVARIHRDKVEPQGKLPPYETWEFLHRGKTSSLFPGLPEIPIWVAGDDRLANLRSVATNVAQEFSVHRLIPGGCFEPRWVLVHAWWPFVNAPGYLGVGNFATDFGIVRISENDYPSGHPSFLDFPDNEEEFYWIDVNDKLETELEQIRDDAAAAAQGGGLPADYVMPLFRGFSAYPHLSDFPELLVGYTIFASHVGNPAENCETNPLCTPYGNNLCGDIGGPCGARRFATIDLEEIWPKRELCRRDFLDPCIWQQPPPPTCFERPFPWPPVETRTLATIHPRLAELGLTLREQRQLAELAQLPRQELTRLVEDVVRGRVTQLDTAVSDALSLVSPQEWDTLVATIADSSLIR